MRRYVVLMLILPLCVFLAEGQGALDTDVPSQVLSFKYREGGRYSILSRVHEDAYMNLRRVNHAEIVNRISVKTAAVHPDGSGTLECTFMTTEDSSIGGTSQTLSFGEEFFSRFDRSAQGRYTISDEYFMPVVRDDPIFPSTPVTPGDVWEADGYEAEDLRRAFGIPQPFKVPFKAKYKFLGGTQSEGKTFCVIDVKYDLRYDSPPPPAGTPISELAARPVRTEGYSHETLYWDNERGEIDHYIEDFRIEIETYYGDRYVFQGIAEAQTLETEATQSGETLSTVEEAIEDMGLEDVKVSRGEKGLTISMERIQFMPDSSILMDSEKEKIQKIAAIIAPYNNDLLVTGHCALRGSEEARKAISEERAKSVADYLVEIGVRNSYHIFRRGKGGSEPVADNDTEEGRALNRRVEITLMDD